MPEGGHRVDPGSVAGRVEGGEGRHQNGEEHDGHRDPGREDEDRALRSTFSSRITIARTQASPG